MVTLIQIWSNGQIGIYLFYNSPQFAIAQIRIKMLFEHFTDARGPVYGSSCLRKTPKKPWTLEEAVSLEVEFYEEQNIFKK